MKIYHHFMLLSLLLFLNCGCGSIGVHYDALQSWVTLDDGTLASYEGNTQSYNPEYFPYFASYNECACLIAPFSKIFWSEKRDRVKRVHAVAFSLLDLPFSAVVDTIMLPFDLRGYKYPSVHDVNPTVYDANVRNMSSNKIDYISQPYNNISQIDIGKSIWIGTHTGFSEIIRIKWEKENGEIIEKRVLLNGKIPKGFWNRDDIIFNINDNDDIILSFKIKNIKYYEIDSNGNKVYYGDSSGI